MQIEQRLKHESRLLMRYFEDVDVAEPVAVAVTVRVDVPLEEADGDAVPEPEAEFQPQLLMGLRKKVPQRGQTLLLDIHADPAP